MNKKTIFSLMFLTALAIAGLYKPIDNFSREMDAISQIKKADVLYLPAGHKSETLPNGYEGIIVEIAAVELESAGLPSSDRVIWNYLYNTGVETDMIEGMSWNKTGNDKTNGYPMLDFRNYKVIAKFALADLGEPGLAFFKGGKSPTIPLKDPKTYVVWEQQIDNRDQIYTQLAEEMGINYIGTETLENGNNVDIFKYEVKSGDYAMSLIEQKIWDIADENGLRYDKGIDHIVTYRASNSVRGKHINDVWPKDELEFEAEYDSVFTRFEIDQRDIPKYDSLDNVEFEFEIEASDSNDEVEFEIEVTQ